MKASEVLLGQYVRPIDTRGRVFLPEPFRAAMSPQCVVTLGEGVFLRLFSLDRWEEYLERIHESGNISDEEMDEVSRVVAMSYITNPDRQGRLAIPMELREYARLTGDILFSGNLYWIEIWNQQLWESHIALKKS